MRERTARPVRTDAPASPTSPSGSVEGRARDPGPTAAASLSAPGSSRSRSRLAEILATCLFIGRIPLAPGTFGAALGLAAFWGTRSLSVPIQAGLLIAATLAGVWAAHRHAADLKTKDPQSIVVDEFVGMWLALVALDNPSGATLAAAFVGFRALDIVKPPPVSWAERLPGGLGIMADDLVAGALVRAAFVLFL